MYRLCVFSLNFNEKIRSQQTYGDDVDNDIYQVRNEVRKYLTDAMTNGRS